MITKKRTEVYTTEDGTEHKTLVEAQCHELTVLLFDFQNSPEINKSVAAFLVSKQIQVAETLTTKARKPRKSNGKPRGRTRLPLGIKGKNDPKDIVASEVAS